MCVLGTPLFRMRMICPEGHKDPRGQPISTVGILRFVPRRKATCVPPNLEDRFQRKSRNHASMNICMQAQSTTPKQTLPASENRSSISPGPPHLHMLTKGGLRQRSRGRRGNRDREKEKERKRKQKRGVESRKEGGVEDEEREEEKQKPRQRENSGILKDKHLPDI